MLDRVHHVAFVVEDVGKTARWMEDTFDLPLYGREQMTGRYEVDIAIFDIGGVLVEFIEPTSTDGWTYEHLRRHGEGFFHIAFEVDDIGQRVKDLRERGLRFETDEPTTGFDWEVITFDESDTFVTMQLVED